MGRGGSDLYRLVGFQRAWHLAHKHGESNGVLTPSCLS
nr:MAG TPA: hypothetical protein [Caudoviricetes sp.]